ncbi:hypothetical protein FHS14_000605 [Paenibacillus baekrokdamisoli]|uniref:hypothetical protein n=1 Tax=Paenibacillus baekrokdamisoli TaxID=1712516 RepID=UPI000F7717EA|nr:hypothetical protein [Paenibacillus baekrokdamisoli]MBB3067635.1 hypothetical protein [Paenibacillus baekrokdamisoli]
MNNNTGVKNNNDEAFYARKRYYVSVQAGSILESPTLAAYELVIEANQEERDQLEEWFGELSSMDEAEALHFTEHPFGSATVEEMSRGVDGILEEIYKQLYRLGTSETKNHIAMMGLFPEGNLK